VPVSVRYDDPQSFRSRARVRFLPAIPVAPFAAIADQQGAVRALTGAVRDALEPNVVHIEDETLAWFVKEIDDIYGRSVAPTTGGGRLSAAPAIALAVNSFARSDPARVKMVKEKIDRYRTALIQAGLDDAVVRPASGRTTPGQDVALLAGAPFALVGVVTSWLPYQIPRLVTGAFVKDPTFVSTIKLIVGIFVFALFYAAEGFAVAQLAGTLAGVLVGLALPVAGIVALEELEAWGARSRRRRRRRLRAKTSPEALRELEALRADVIAELDRGRAEFLLARDDPQPEEGLL